MSQSVEESIAEMAVHISTQAHESDGIRGTNDEAGHETTPSGCECGCGPNVDYLTGLTALLAFQGVDDGLCDPFEDHEFQEPTYADLKHVKECIEHVFEAHKESVEISPGIFLDQKEARGYLISIMLGRGLLPSAQLAHGIGVQVADAVRRAEREAQRDAQAAKKKAARQGLAAGPNGPREAAGKAAADLVWARTALLADLPEARVVAKVKPKTPAKLKTPATFPTAAHRPVSREEDDPQTKMVFDDAADDAEPTREGSPARVAELNAAACEAVSLNEEVMAACEAVRLNEECRKRDWDLAMARSRQEGWNACLARASEIIDPILQEERARGDSYKKSLLTAEWHNRRLDRALDKADIYIDIYNSEYDSEDVGECSESELSVPAPNV